MKVLIISDIHGKLDNLQKVLSNNSFDLLLLLGDTLVGPFNQYKKVANLLNSYKGKIISVKGNCDNYYNGMLEYNNDETYLKVPIDEKVFFLTHGHLYNKYNLPATYYDVFVQGHTHVPLLEKLNDKIYLNPGSISLPRSNSLPSYAIYEDNKITILDINNNILKELSINK